MRRRPRKSTAVPAISVESSSGNDAAPATIDACERAAVALQHQPRERDHRDTVAGRGGQRREQDEVKGRRGETWEFGQEI